MNNNKEGLRWYFVSLQGFIVLMLRSRLLTVGQGSGDGGKKKTKDTSLNERDKDKMIKLTSLSVTTEKRNALTIEVYRYCCTLP